MRECLIDEHETAVAARSGVRQALRCGQIKGTGQQLAEVADSLLQPYLESRARIVEGLLQRAQVQVADVDVQVGGIGGLQEFIL